MYVGDIEDEDGEDGEVKLEVRIWMAWVSWVGGSEQSEGGGEFWGLIHLEILRGIKQYACSNTLIINEVMFS